MVLHSPSDMMYMVLASWITYCMQISCTNPLNSLPYVIFFQMVQIESICRRKNNMQRRNGKFFFEWVEKIVGNGENAGYQQFLLFPQCFQKAAFSGSLKVWIVWQRVKMNFPLGCENLRLCG